METSRIIKMANRRAVLATALFAGFWGGHKFLLGARREGYLYLFFCWTLVPAIATLIDIADLSFAPHVQGRFPVRSWEARNEIERSTWIRLGIGCLVIALWIVVGLRYR